jgi:ABC-type multidrug transport system ATPase subunit
MQVIYLDEPTGALDPMSRRHLWDLINRVKRERAIILTTHSMEEADILGDRIGIMARGKLMCIGTSLRLKSRFGSGYRVSVRVEGQPYSNNGLNDLATNGTARSTVERDSVASEQMDRLKDIFMDRLGVKSGKPPSDTLAKKSAFNSVNIITILILYDFQWMRLWTTFTS